MEIKVRAIDGAEPKGVQELEQELLDKHEQQMQQQEPPANDDPTPEPEPPAPEEQELKEEDVLSFIGKRYGKQINSFDELMSARQETEELPADVSAYMKYRKETGRGYQDFLKLNEDIETKDPDALLKDYLKSINEGLDDDDIDVMMAEYSYDEELDDEADVKRIKIAKKKAVAEAKKFFTAEKEKYKMPLESSKASIPDSEKEEYEAYKQYINQAKTLQEENERKRKWFEDKTEELFGNEFKGFEFKVDDKSFTFMPGDRTEIKKLQSNPTNFIAKFLDENGMIKDHVGYHRALSIAMNPDKFAKFFYEQGVASATEDVARKIKNVNMSERRAPEATSGKGGMQVRPVNPDSGRSLKIRSIKKV